MIKFRKLVVATAAAGTLALTLGASAASASAHPNGTLQCHTQANCTTPDVFVNTGPEPAMTVTVIARNAPVVTAQNDDTNAAQDWRYTDYGTVGDLTNFGDGPFQFGLTAEDYSLYGSDEVYGLQASPGGFLAGKCLANIHNRGVLRTCRVGEWQRFIAADGSEFGAPLINPDGAYGLSVVPANNAAGHNALTAPFLNAALLFTSPAGTNSQNWDNDDSSGSPG